MVNISDLLILIFSGVVALSTMIYAFLTWRLVSETQRLREVQTEPRVSVRVEPDHAYRGYQLVIRNEGHGPAKNVRFEFTGDPTYFRNSFVGNAPPPIDQLPAIRDGLEYMETGYTISFPLGTTAEEEFNRASEAPWRFVVNYENFCGRGKKNTYVIDFSQFNGLMYEEIWPKLIAEHLDEIRKELHSVNERLRRSLPENDRVN